jgi:hypothetical protein
MSVSHRPASRTPRDAEEARREPGRLDPAFRAPVRVGAVAAALRAIRTEASAKTV